MGEETWGYLWADLVQPLLAFFFIIFAVEVAINLAGWASDDVAGDSEKDPD